MKLIDIHKLFRHSEFSFSLSPITVTSQTLLSAVLIDTHYRNLCSGLTIYFDEFSLLRSNEHESWQERYLECSQKYCLEWIPRNFGLEKNREIFEHCDTCRNRNFMLLCRAVLRQRFPRHRLGRVELARFSHNLRLPVFHGWRHPSAVCAQLVEFSTLAKD